MSTQSEQIGELAAALAKAQGEITGALKDSKNPFFKSNYADLASVWDACRGQLSKNNLSVSQTTTVQGDLGICVVTTIMHSSGEWLSGILPIMAVKNDPQGIGSAITYSRRYALAAIVGIAQVDDDAEGSMGRRPNSEVQPQGQKPSPFRVHGTQWDRRAIAEIPEPELRKELEKLELVQKPTLDQQQTMNQIQEHLKRLPASLPVLSCDGCRTELRFSSTTKKYYCPKFKDKSVEHSVVPEASVEQWKADRAESVSEPLHDFEGVPA